MAKDELTLDDLRSTMARRAIAPVYLVYGDEDFLAEEASDLIISSTLTREQQSFNLDVVYGADGDARDIVSHASSFPMMSERRVVVVRDFDRLGNKELLAAYMEQPAASTCLILHSIKPDFRKKPYTTAKRHSTLVRCDAIREYQIAGWIGRRARAQGFEIDPEAVKILAAYVGTSLREIQNELNKLYIFIGEKRTITSDDIRAVVGVSKEYNVFELQGAIGSKNVARAVEILDRMLDAGESPVLVIVMLTRYFTALWKLHDHRRRGTSPSELAGAIGVNPYFVKEYLASLGNYTLDEIEHAFEVLTNADLQLKSAPLDPLQIMQNMLLGLMKQEELALV